MGGQTGHGRRRLSAGLGAAAAAVAARAAALAGPARSGVYLVGGTVRDLLLGRPLRDLDLLVAGDAAGLARRLAADLGVTMSAHERFGTASLHLPGPPWRVDLASARRERYAGAGRLPEVAPGGVAEDLARRDFTVNAMAWRLGAGGGPRLIDPLGGQGDLERRLIRILHPGSFRDDPTRAFRAVRLAARLGFRLEQATAGALGQAVAAGRTRALSPARLGRELRLLLEEATWPAAVAAADRHGLLAGLGSGLAHPGIAVAARLQRLLAGSAPGQRLVALLAALLVAGRRASVTPEAPGQWPGGVALRAQRLAADTMARLRRMGTAGDCAALLEGCPELAEDDGSLLVLAQAFAPAAGTRRALGLLRRRRARLRLAITPEDLAAAGVQAGPELGRRLAAVRRQRLAGRLRGRRAQLAWALTPAAAAG